jgi:hypothetical protein
VTLTLTNSYRDGIVGSEYRASGYDYNTPYNSPSPYTSTGVPLGGHLVGRSGPSYRVDIMHKHAATLVEKVQDKLDRVIRVTAHFTTQSKFLEEKILKSFQKGLEKLSHSSLRLSEAQKSVESVKSLIDRDLKQRESVVVGLKVRVRVRVRVSVTPTPNSNHHYKLYPYP